VSRLVYPKAAELPAGAPPIPQENIYGHVQRLEWLREQLAPSDRAVEFGCGTGYMITYPLRTWGYEVTGVDIDADSIEYGQQLLEQAGIEPEALRLEDLRDVEGELDAVIASEVFEHLDDQVLSASLDTIHEKLRPGGKLLVTTPNGWGWFELEALLWNRLGAGAYLQRRAERGARDSTLSRAKRHVVGDYVADACSSTLAHSPHVQRFTFRSIQRVIAAHGFEVVQARGAVLACGPLSDLALTGVEGAMRLNRRLGRRLPMIAAGFYVAAVRA
jgi:2-polyprenyl-3-methyl-5-hydroxy-6-metoxy-1,4-benzoquinol methylase